MLKKEDYFILEGIHWIFKNPICTIYDGDDIIREFWIAVRKDKDEVAIWYKVADVMLEAKGSTWKERKYTLNEYLSGFNFVQEIRRN